MFENLKVDAVIKASDRLSAFPSNLALEGGDSGAISDFSITCCVPLKAHLLPAIDGGSTRGGYNSKLRRFHSTDILKEYLLSHNGNYITRVQASSDLR